MPRLVPSPISRRAPRIGAAPGPFEPVAERSSWLARAANALWDRWRSDRALRLSVVGALAAWIVLETMFVGYLHDFCEGRAHYALLPGTHFGLPEREMAAGLQMVCHIGADGQQYYRQSNDVFVRHDAWRHLDEPLYRYQRIGLPMMAGGLATLLGFDLTPPSLYLTLPFAMASLGFGALMYWLAIHQVHPAFALTWLVSGGTLASLWLGLSDPVGDALFVLTVLVAVWGRLKWYAPLATLLLLTRETYALYSLAVVCLTMVGKTDWRDVASRRWQTALTALPLVVMSCWTLYLTIVFQKSPMAARSNPGMLGWPLVRMFQASEKFYSADRWLELRMWAVSAVTIVLVCLLVAVRWRRLHWALRSAPACLLVIACSGYEIWAGCASSMRVSSAALTIGLLMLPFDRSAWLKAVLIWQGIAGIELHADWRMMHARLLSPHLLHEEQGWHPLLDANAPPNSLVVEPRGQVEWRDVQTSFQPRYSGVWSRWHREIVPISLAVTNHSTTLWQPGRGRFPITVWCTLFDEADKHLCDHRMVLEKPVPPGATIEMPAYLELRAPGRRYAVEFSIHQHGPGRFATPDAEPPRRYEFTVD